MTSLTTGVKAPSFSTWNQDGNQVGLGDFAGKYLVLYFYPKALTPGCTTQACVIRDNKLELDAQGVAVVGVSPDPVAKLKKFRAKHELNFDLLSDEDHTIADAYGVWGLKKFMGKEFMGVIRTTFVIDPKGTVAAVLDDFTTSSHHRVLLDWFAENDVN